MYNDGDYLQIFDVYDDGNSRMIASLLGPDIGPNLLSFGNWQKKIISSTSNKMMVEFRSDSVRETDRHSACGFSASIHYSSLPITECENGLDMTMKTIQSPNYPNSYDNNLSCKWLISVPHGYHITLKFLQFDVRYFSTLNVSDFSNHIVVFSLQLEDGIPCYSTCGSLYLKGDGICQDQNNNCGCEWDGGDCCGISNCLACDCIELIGDGNDFLSIHNGGGDDSEMVAKMTGQMNDTKIYTPGNQMFLVFHTNEKIVRKGFHALIMEGKYLF